MERHHGMDWLRIGAFGLLIFFHIGMVFTPWPWHVKTAQPLDWVAVPMLASNAWRLSLLFVVSGFASAAMLDRDGPTHTKKVGAFMRARNARLLIPLAFAVVFIVPVQPWIELVTQHGYSAGFLTFWTTDYFRFGTLDGIILPTWQHLWFVAYLWAYTAAFALLTVVLPALARAAIGRVAGRLLSGYGLLIVPLAWLIARRFVAGPWPTETHALVDDWAWHAVYFPAFLFGVLLRRNEAVWSAVRGTWRTAAVLALAAYGIVAAVEIAYPGTAVPPDAIRFAFGIARQVQAWMAIVALIGLADRYLNHDHRWRAPLAEAVFPCYIIHQTVIVVVGWAILPLALGPLAEFLIILAATVAGCWLFTILCSRIGWLRPLAGLKPRKVARSVMPRMATV